MDDERRELLDLFKEEGHERLARAASLLEELATVVDPAPALQGVDRELHTIKGSARMLGFVELGGLVHEIEGLARALRDSPKKPGLRELMIEAIDKLVVLIDRCAGDDKDATDEQILARVRAAVPATTPAGGAKTKPKTGKFAPLAAPPPAPAPTQATPAEDPDAETKNFRVVSRRRADDTATPLAPVNDPEDTRTHAVVERPEPPTKGYRDKEGTTRLRPASSTAEVEQRQRSTGRPEEDDDLVRVRASKLARLDAFVSELALARLRLEAGEESLRQLAAQLEEQGQPDAAAAIRRQARKSKEDRGQLARIAKGLERLAIDVRLRPVGRVLDPLPREARELARRLGKKVRLRISGAETELDRAILDGVKDPLLHCLRNSIDHGIEPPAERLAAGKPEEGLIEIEASQDGGSVVIRARDDGRGIDPVQLRASAVKKGLLDREKAARLSDEDSMALVFVPGFSTKEVTTEISGRGIGLDVVKKNVESLKGEVRLSSVKGQGTEIALRLPLTALVSRVLFARAGEALVGFATSAVESTAVVLPTQLSQIEGRPMIRHRGRAVPIARLSAFFDDGRREPVLGGRALHLAVVRHGDDILALEVDSFQGERSVVVRPLGWPLERVRGLAGAVQLGATDLALLVHVPDLIEQFREGAGRFVVPAGIREPQARRRVLIVDDSVITRQLERRIMEGLGFDVDLAVDGQDALRLLETGAPPALILTDVEMPRLDGLGLVKKIKKETRLRDIPIVIVSTRGAEEDRKAGLEAGADAYIVKSAFEERTLRETIERLLS